MIDESWFLERNKEYIYPRVDPMLMEASLGLQVLHNHVQESDLHDNTSEHCTLSLAEILLSHIFQPKVESNHDNMKDQFLSGGEYYDELWLFGKECWINICMHIVSLRFGIDGVIIK